jgi:NADP-dependent aldehyde dehydrogenase
MHLATGELVASAIIKAAQKTKMPNGVFSNLNGGIELGAALVKHPMIKGVGFTGSTKGGRALMDLANQRPDPIPVFAEMGSINPIVLLPQALKKSSYKWATAFAASIALGTGQFCTSPGVMIAVKGEELILFEQLLEEEFRKMNASCMLHPAIKSAFVNAKEMMKSQKGITIRFENQDNAPATSVFPNLLTVDGETFLQNKTLHQEVFGSFALIVECMNRQQLVQILQQLDGQLTATLISENEDASTCAELIPILEMKVGRMIFNGVPTGTEVCASMMHGGPYPASSDSRFTAVGVSAVQRWVRPVCYQNWPDELLPPALKNENPLKIIRTVNLQLTATTIPSCQEKLSFA